MATNGPFIYTLSGAVLTSVGRAFSLPSAPPHVTEEQMKRGFESFREKAKKPIGKSSVLKQHHQDTGKFPGDMMG